MDNLPSWVSWIMTIAVVISPGIAFLSVRPIARLLHYLLWPRPSASFFLYTLFPPCLRVLCKAMSAKSGSTISYISESPAIATSGVSSDIICIITVRAALKKASGSPVGFGILYSTLGIQSQFANRSSKRAVALAPRK